MNYGFVNFRPIVGMIRGRNMQVQVKASCALQALAENNAESQQAFLELDAPKVLIRLYVKVWIIYQKVIEKCQRIRDI